MRGLTEADLIRTALAAGFDCSPDQLRRLRRAGAIQRPEQEHVLGLRGSRSVYPSSTDEQLIEILRIHATERRLQMVVFRGWWEGLNVDPIAVRSFLVEELESDITALRTFMKGRAFGWADRLSAMVRASRHPTVRWIRSNLKRRPTRDDHLVAVVSTLLLAASGQPEALEGKSGHDDEPDIGELASRGIGLRALTDSLGGLEPIFAEPPELRPSVEPFLPKRILAVLQQADSEAIRDALDDARFFAFEVTLFVRAAQALFHRRRVLGLEVLLNAERDDRRGWEFRRVLVSLSLVLRSMGLRESLDEFKGAVREVVPNAREFLEAHRKGRATIPA